MNQNLDALKLKINQLEEELNYIRKLQQPNKSCCKNLCDSFNKITNDIEIELLNIDIKLYSKIQRLDKMKFLFPNKLNNEDIKSFKTSITKDQKYIILINKKEELLNILSQIKQNNLCDCDMYAFTKKRNK